MGSTGPLRGTDPGGAGGPTRVAAFSGGNSAHLEGATVQRVRRPGRSAGGPTRVAAFSGGNSAHLEGATVQRVRRPPTLPAAHPAGRPPASLTSRRQQSGRSDGGDTYWCATDADASAQDATTPFRLLGVVARDDQQVVALGSSEAHTGDQLGWHVDPVQDLASR